MPCGAWCRILPCKILIGEAGSKMQAEACIVSAANGAGDGVGVLAVPWGLASTLYCRVCLIRPLGRMPSFWLRREGLLALACRRWRRRGIQPEGR